MNASSVHHQYRLARSIETLLIRSSSVIHPHLATTSIVSAASSITAAQAISTRRFSGGMELSGSCHCRAVKFTVKSHTPVPYQHCYCESSICITLLNVLSSGSDHTEIRCTARFLLAHMLPCCSMGICAGTICRKTQGSAGAAINLAADNKTLKASMMCTCHQRAADRTQPSMMSHDDLAWCPPIDSHRIHQLRELFCRKRARRQCTTQCWTRTPARPAPQSATSARVSPCALSDANRVTQEAAHHCVLWAGPLVEVLLPRSAECGSHLWLYDSRWPELIHPQVSGLRNAPPRCPWRHGHPGCDVQCLHCRRAPLTLRCPNPGPWCA